MTKTPDAPRAATSAANAAAALKKFYERATVGPRPDGSSTVLLDGRPVRTPGKAALAAPRPVAEAMAGEWNAQDTHIDPLSMPLTRLVNTAIDGVAHAAAQVKADIVAIAGNDLVVYRAEGPEKLVARQAAHWDPVIAHSAKRFGLNIRVTNGIMPVSQDQRLAETVHTALPNGACPLAALHQITTLTGSALIALALHDAAISFADAWDAAHVDEDFNIEAWGEDAEAAARRALRRRDAEAAAFLLGETL